VANGSGAAVDNKEQSAPNGTQQTNAGGSGVRQDQSASSTPQQHEKKESEGPCGLPFKCSIL